MTPKLFSELGLSPELLKAIDQLGFEQAAPIQAEAIPILMQGRDVVGQSQTGSGKTAAFAAPAIEKVDVAQRATQVLILCPTRELAIQVSEEVHKLALFKRGLHALPVYGGQSYDRQLAGLRQGAHIVIGTPGRVMDHMRRGTLKLAAIKMVVLDEVDVMLNMGFRDDIEQILQATPKERQTVFFSATIPRPIQQLIEKYSRDPQQVRIEQKALTVPTVEQVYYEVDRRYKVDLLTRLIDIHDLKLGIIFCNTKRMVDDLVDHLNAQGYSADRLHGDMTQMMRDRVMQKFRKSGLDFLVATDVAARGIDVDDVEVVFNYDLPYDGEDYVHRIGRTGRKGRSGRAISFASGREVFQIRNIERYTNVRIQRGQPPTANEVEEARTMVFLDKLRATLKGGEYKRHDRLIERLLEEGFASTDIASALIHHLQGGDAAPAKPAPRPEERPRAEERPSRPQRVPERRDVRPSAPPPRRTQPAERPPRPQLRPAPAPAAPAPPPVPVASVTVAKPAIQSTPKPPPRQIVVPAVASEAPKPKERPQTQPFQKRLWMNIGAEMGVVSEDIVNIISGETGLPASILGAVDIRQRHLFVDVVAEHANSIIAKLNRAQLKGQKIKVKAA
ncbi:MAG TPA: DEAD/DEAH box helicase [Candidatus Baltobacteraceae bacterium]|jgi:ATP-dependent RNA helicase DeaD|nr:DEAD/DEAH box helicase [Candidatus Baltobacteraceae bacterium]